MIGWLSGQIMAVEPEGELLVDVGGVGYRVTVPPSVASGAGHSGGPVALHIHTHVREDALVLYGFESLAERRCFELLLGAHGVGPSLALAMIAMLGPDGLARSVVDEDLDMLCSVPGVGRKTAARLVLELSSKMAGFVAGGALPGASRAGEAAGDPGAGVSATAAGAAARNVARAALAELGFSPDEVRQALVAVPGDGSADELLRQALQHLAAGAPVGARRRGPDRAALP